MEQENNQGNKQNFKINGLLGFFFSIINELKKHPLLVVCAGALLLAIFTPREGVALVAFLVFASVFIVAGLISIIIYFFRRPAEAKTNYIGESSEPIIVPQNGIWNRWCSVIHSYPSDYYSNQASLSANKNTNAIFTFCAYNPTEIIAEVARRLYRREITNEDRPYVEEGYNDTLRCVRELNIEQFSQAVNTFFEHFRTFREKAIIPTELLDHKEKCWVIRVLFVKKSYESEYQKVAEKEKYYQDFLKFKALNDPIICFTLTERMCKDIECGLGIREITDFTIFLYSPKKQIQSLDSILKEWHSIDDLVLDYYQESNTIIASSKIPSDRKGKFFYHSVLEQFSRKYRDKYVFRPLPVYMSEKFGYEISVSDKKIFGLLGIDL